MRAYLIDREGRFPEREDALPTLLALPARASQALEASASRVPAGRSPRPGPPWT